MTETTNNILHLDKLSDVYLTITTNMLNLSCRCTVINRVQAFDHLCKVWDPDIETYILRHFHGKYYVRPTSIRPRGIIYAPEFDANVCQMTVLFTGEMSRDKFYLNLKKKHPAIW